ncbi:hypothetical protein LCGC14_2945040, partial [marine sediment metagenome]
STDLPTSSTVVGTISATELRTVVTDWMMVSPDGRTVAVAKGGTPTTLQLVDVTDHKNPTLLGNVSTSIDIGNAMQPVWLSRSSYLLIPVSSAVLIIDVSDLNDPLEVGTIVVADSDLTFMRACKTNRAETTLYIAGKGGVEAWDISKITAPTQVSSVGTGTKIYVDIALNESADWLAIVLQTSSININVTTVDISTTDSAVITLNTSNDIAGSYSTWGSFKEIVGQNDAIAAITTAVSGNARFVVFDLSDLTAVTIDNDFDIDTFCGDVDNCPFDANADQSDIDGDGFVEYQRKSRRGLINQGWKDSWDGIVDEEGNPLVPPIALVEVQGYMYAAKQKIADVYESLGDPARANQLREESAVLRRRINADFWIPEGY